MIISYSSYFLVYSLLYISLNHLNYSIITANYSNYGVIIDRRYLEIVLNDSSCPKTYMQTQKWLVLGAQFSIYHRFSKFLIITLRSKLKWICAGPSHGPNDLKSCIHSYIIKSNTQKNPLGCICKIKFPMGKRCTLPPGCLFGTGEY